MSVINRGVRNAFRNTIRTFSLVIILGLVVGLALTMLVARRAVTAKIDSVKSAIGNTITVSPAGARGFGGGGNPLTADNVNAIKTTPHVASVTASINDRLDTIGANTPSFGGDSNSTGTTNLVSPITPGSLGRRFGGRGNNSNSANFTLPITVTGSSDPNSTQVAGSNQLKITAGVSIDGSSNQHVAMVGKDLATKNNLNVGSTFSAYGQTITVAAIYDAGNTFANGGVIMPLAAVQNLSGQVGDVTNVIVQVDSISNISSTVTDLQNKLGTTADVVSQQDTSNQALAPLENIKSLSLYSLIGAVGAGAAIILLTMMMIVRERRREIGVLKAIGASNLKVVLQFVSEATTLTLLGAVVGLIIGFVGGNPVTKLLVSSSANAAQTTGMNGPGGGGGGGRLLRLAGQGLGGLRNVNAVVGWDILLFGLGAAIVIAIIGSAIPALVIAKVRPAEVMRAE